MSLSAGSLAITVLFFFGQASSHMVMSHPYPFNKGLDTTPLVNVKPGSAGSDYPCKQRPGVYDIGEHGVNDMAVGSPIALKFNGSASHGGGTCQIAISRDEKPDFKSVWKVIQVFEGGCPTPEDGNSGSTNFTFQIPKGFPNGRSTLSWTWYNKIGNREVYQNCAPIAISGGSGTNEVYDSLPNLYLINLPTTECTTVETTDLEIPNPGQSVIKDSSVLKGATGPSCAASAAAQTEGASGYQTGSPEGDSSSYSAASATASTYGGTASFASSNDGSYGAASTMATFVSSRPSILKSSAAAELPSSFPTMTPSFGAGILGPGTASGFAAAPTGSPYGSGTSSGGESSSGASSGSVSQQSGVIDVYSYRSSLSSVAVTEPSARPSSSGAPGTICTPNGAVVCNGSSQFGLCNNGKVVFQAVAAGTTCSNGQIQKRSARQHAHIRRHAQDSGRYV